MIFGNPMMMAGGAGGVVARYWRIYITGSESGDTFAANIFELEFRGSPGSSDLTGGGTPSASTIVSGFEADKAFDNNTATGWVSESRAALPQWLAYDFGTAVSVGQVALTSGDTSARADRTPSEFLIQYSDNGSAWTTALSVSGEISWGITETRAFNL